MAYFFGDGFDLYALPADAVLGYWDSGTTAFALTTGRFSGSRGITYSGSSAPWLAKSSGSNDAVHHIVCAFQQTGAITGTQQGLYFQLTDGSTNQVCIVFRSDGAILLTSATPGGTVLATYTGAVTANNTWYAFEFEVVINNTTGSFAVRKNGNTSNDFSAASLNTRPGTNAYANKLQVATVGSITSHLLDDLLWRSDAASVPWVGDVRCYTRRPASDASVAWTRGGVVAGLTQSLPSNTTASVANNTIRLTSYTINYTGTITSVVGVTFSLATGNMKCAIWADNGGAPGAVLASTGPVATIAAGNNVFTLGTPLPVTSGQKIWIGTLNDTSGGNYSVGAANTGGTAAGTYATFPQASPVLTTNNGLVSSITYGTAAGNFAMVGEQQQDAASSYVSSSNVGDSDLYTIDGISGTPVSIVGVTTRALMQKSDAGSRTVAVQLKSGATTVESAASALNTVWSWVYRTDLTDPATGSAWTAVGLNSAQIGVIVKT